jgi:cyclopropane-fatty-acyl-phospholipid synthase
MTVTETILGAVERGWVPDRLVRGGIRRLLRDRLRDEDRGDPEANERAVSEHVRAMREGPVAVATDAANQQHYEVPARFFRAALGPRLKYSSCLFEDGVDDLAAAEEAMLALTCERADLRDGQRVLDLGCGWGSFSLWAAEQYPASRITAVSNSASQREFIEGEAARRGLDNVTVVTCDMNAFDPGARFDRIVSIEMFEHMRNWESLFGRVASWLEDDGRFFLHVFCHRDLAYFYEDAGDDDWMARHFFTGGQMPSFDLPRRFDRDLIVERDWKVDGRHYERTLRAWLARQDARREEVLAMFRDVYGAADARRWFERWRLFFLACAELFGYREGSEWFVGHYRLARRGPGDAAATPEA